MLIYVLKINNFSGVVILLGSAFHHTFSTVCNSQLFNEIIKVSVHYSREIMLSIADTVIRYTALRIIVCPDFFLSFPGTNN